MLDEDKYQPSISGLCGLDDLMADGDESTTYPSFSLAPIVKCPIVIRIQVHARILDPLSSVSLLQQRIRLTSSSVHHRQVDQVMCDVI